MKFFAPVLACAAAFACLPALAMEDQATGLKVDLPEQFTLEATQRPDYQATIGVNTASGLPSIAGTGEYLCEIGFQNAPQNAGFTQDEINATIGTPEWGEMAKAGLETVFTIHSAEGFNLDGINGGEFTATPKAGPDALDVRVFLSMLETPKGRTVVTCATTAGELEGALAVFRTIRNGITPPG